MEIRNETIKLGLVLSGGGAKGAYQVGVWLALQQLGLKEKLLGISGTSVGALNGVLFIQEDYLGCVGFWKKAMLEGKKKGKNRQLFDNIKRSQFLKADHLRKLLEESIDCEALKASKCQLYVTVHNLKKNKPESYCLNQESKKTIIDCLMSSVAIPLIFPLAKFQDGIYCDGGVSCNVPIEPLKKMGCNLILVVDISSKPKKFTDDSIVVIKPSVSIGKFRDGTMNFYSDSITKAMQIGYLDTMTLLRRILPLYNWVL